MPIGRKKILRAGVQVGEITAAAAGDQNLLADSIRAFEQQDPPAPFPAFEGTHQAGRAGSENDDIVFLIHAITSLTGSARVGTGALARPSRAQARQSPAATATLVSFWPATNASRLDQRSVGFSDGEPDD